MEFARPIRPRVRPQASEAGRPSPAAGRRPSVDVAITLRRPTHAGLVALQATTGNRAVQRLVAVRSPAPLQREADEDDATREEQEREATEYQEARAALVSRIEAGGADTQQAQIELQMLDEIAREHARQGNPYLQRAVDECAGVQI